MSEVFRYSLKCANPKNQQTSFKLVDMNATAENSDVSKSISVQTTHQIWMGYNDRRPCWVTLSAKNKMLYSSGQLEPKVDDERVKMCDALQFLYNMLMALFGVNSDTRWISPAGSQ